MLKKLRNRYEKIRTMRKEAHKRLEMIRSLEIRRDAQLACITNLASLNLPQSEWEEREANAIKVFKKINDEIDFYLQAELRNKLERAGIEIPSTYDLQTNQGGFNRRLLTEAGRSWANSQLRQRRHQEIEFWCKIVLPILALIMSMISLMFSIVRH